MGLQAALRAGCVTLLEDYRTSAGIKLSVYPGRPSTLHPPHAFVDTMGERITYDGLRQRFPVARIVVVWGPFDSKAAADQRDAFVDGFLDWFRSNEDAAGSNTVSDIGAIEDLPAYVPDWLQEQGAFYATQITVEGYGE